MGTWIYTAGTGSYADTYISGGSATFTVNFTEVNGDTGDATKVLAGALNPVPEPTTLAALGMGVALLARKRRK